jgi:hypothetical protein
MRSVAARLSADVSGGVKIASSSSVSSTVPSDAPRSGSRASGAPTGLPSSWMLFWCVGSLISPHGVLLVLRKFDRGDGPLAIEARQAAKVAGGLRQEQQGFCPRGDGRCVEHDLALRNLDGGECAARHAEKQQAARRALGTVPLKNSPYLWAGGRRSICISCRRRNKALDLPRKQAIFMKSLNLYFL